MNEKLHAAFTHATHRLAGFQVRGSDRRQSQGAVRTYTGPERRGTLAIKRRRSDIAASEPHQPSVQ